MSEATENAGRANRRRAGTMPLLMMLGGVASGVVALFFAPIGVYVGLKALVGPSGKKN